MKSDKKLFKKYLLSYVLVLLVPVLVFGFISYSGFLKALENEVTVNNFNNLLKSKSVIDSELKRLYNIAFQMEKSAEFKPFIYRQNLNKAFELINELQKYTVVNDFAETVIAYFKGDEYLYTNSSSCRMDLFGSKVYRYLSWDREDMMECLENPKTSFFRSLETIEVNSGVERKFVTYISPLPVNGSQKSASIMFLIPEKSISRIFESSVQNYTTGYMILDEEDNIIISNFAVENKEDFKNYFSYSLYHDEGSRAIKLKGRDFMLSWTFSGMESWKYMSITPLNVAMEKVSGAKLGFIFGIIIMLTSGGAAIVWGMYTNYKPIMKIMDYVVSRLNVNKSYVNYYEMIRQAIENLKEQNTDYQKEISKNKRSIRELLVQEALIGYTEGIEVYKKTEKNKNRFLSSPCFSVMLIDKKEGFDFLDEGKKEGITTGLKEILKNGEELYCIWGLLKGKLILVLGYDDSDNNDLIGLIKGLYQELMQILNSTEIIFTYGNSSTGTNGLPRSFFEAAITASGSLESGKSSGIYCFSDQVEEKGSSIDFSEKDFERYRESIYKGDTDSIWSFFSRCISVINDHSVSELAARFLCFDVIFNFIEVMQDMESGFQYLKSEYPDILSIIQFESRSELSKTVKKVFYDISRHIDRVSSDEDLKIKNEIIPYIKENFMKPDFSVQNMADYFGMHTSNFSSYFKSSTGKSASDYISSLKFERTKQLLTETNLTINEIASLMNYSSASSFIRKFKGENGMTPADYRKLHKACASKLSK